MFSAFLRKSVYIICIITFLLMILATVYFIYGNYTVSVPLRIIFFFLMFLVLMVLTFLTLKISSNKTLMYIVIASVSIILCGLWGLFSKTIPVSDYKVLLEGAREIATGTFREGFDKTSYFYFYNYQIGFASYLASIMLLFGQKLLWFKLLEIAYIACSAILVYSISKKLLDYRIAAVAAVIYSTFIFNIMGSSVINNQHISALFMLVGIRLLLYDKRVAIMAAGAFFALTNVMRPIGLVIVIAVILKFLYDWSVDKKWRKHLPNIAILLISFYAVICIFNFAFIKANLTPTPVSNSNIPYFKFVIGLGAPNGSIRNNVTTDTRRTGVYNDLNNLHFDYAKYNSESLIFLKHQIKNYKVTAPFLFEKMRMFTGERDQQYTFALDKTQQSKSIVIKMSALGHSEYMILLCFALLGVFVSMKKKSDMNLIHIAFLCFIWVYLFIEVQTRYRYDAYIFIIILAAEGLVFFNDKVIDYIRAKKSLNKKSLNLKQSETKSRKSLREKFTV